MATYKVRIEGIAPLLMHRFSEEDRAQVEAGTSNRVRSNDPKAAAERAAYRLPNGELYVVAEAVEGALIKAAGFHKIGRRSAVGFAKAGLFIEERALTLGEHTYEIDGRRVVNPHTKGAQVCYRPRLDKWRLSFHLVADDALFPGADFVKALLVDAGRKIGIGSFRPRFGRFVVTAFEEKD